MENVIERLVAHIQAECSIVDRQAQFDDMLDECYSFDSVGGPFACMSPSSVLKEVDPVAYRCGVNDYFGTDDSFQEVAGETYRADEVSTARESFLDELQERIDDLQAEIDDPGNDWDNDTQGLAKRQRDLAELQADYKTAEEYAL